MAKDIKYTIVLGNAGAGHRAFEALQARNLILRGDLLSIDVETQRQKTKDLLRKTELLSMELRKTLTQTIEAIVLPADQYSGLECDGMVRVLSYLLKKAGIEFITYQGRLQTAQQDILHYWIEIPYQSQKETKYLTVDLRARMWLSVGLPEEDIPHGVFKQKDYEKVEYAPDTTVNMTPSKTLYNVLIRI